jgi:ribonuclease P protein component
VLIAAENGLSHDRIGFAASRRLGGAVQRNRARRLLRECFRRNRRGRSPGFDIVLVPKPRLLERGYLELEREYRSGLRRLETRRARARPAADRAD